MGRRGPKPEPTSLRLARGNPSRRPVNGVEPVLGAFDLTPPPDLDAVALERWNGLAKELTDAGVLTSGDRETFATYCRIVGRVAAYDALARTVGPAAAHSVGYEKLLIQLRGQQKQYAAELGLTPSARSGVKAVKPKVDRNDAKRRAFFDVGSNRPA